MSLRHCVTAWTKADVSAKFPARLFGTFPVIV